MILVRAVHRLLHLLVAKFLDVCQKAAKYKRLEGGVRFVEAGEIPKTASGKIKKRELRERAEREMVLEGRPMRFLNSLL